MMTRPPYLIQRLVRIQTKGKIAEKRFGEIFGLDYMGSSEYECGAFAKFLRAMHKASLKPFCVSIEDRKYFGVYDTALYANEQEVEQILNGISQMKFHLKESSNFPPHRTYMAGDAWADIQHNLFWSKENLNYSIIQCISNSVEYMDKQK